MGGYVPAVFPAVRVPDAEPMTIVLRIRGATMAPAPTIVVRKMIVLLDSIVEATVDVAQVGVSPASAMCRFLGAAGPGDVNAQVVMRK